MPRSSQFIKFLSLFFLITGFVSLSQFNYSTHSIKFKFTVLNFSDDTRGSVPNYTPLTKESFWAIQEELSEEENEEYIFGETDVAINLNKFHRLASKSFYFLSQNTLFSFSNIPLYVLFHSWKSFIA